MTGVAAVDRAGLGANALETFLCVTTLRANVEVEGWKRSGDERMSMSMRIHPAPLRRKLASSDVVVGAGDSAIVATTMRERVIGRVFACERFGAAPTGGCWMLCTIESGEGRGSTDDMRRVGLVSGRDTRHSEVHDDVMTITMTDRRPMERPPLLQRLWKRERRG